MNIANQPDKRILEQRARLEFHYPDGETILFVPIYENPKIVETATATYVEYNPLSRAGSLFTYTGTKSRKLKMDLIYTLPHLMNYDMGIDKFRRIFSGNSDESKKLMFTQYSNQAKTAPPAPGSSGNSISTEIDRIYWTIRAQAMSVEDLALELDLLGVTAANAEEELERLTPTQRNVMVDTLLFFVALFRSSVLNNAKNPMQGPPLVRLNFGTLYQSVPCIVKNYNLTWEESAGYDLHTLTPRQLKISLDLQEVRVGDFLDYQPGVFRARDNLTGWESCIDDPYTTDPQLLAK